MPPVTQEYERELDDERLNWVRVRITTHRGRVLYYAVQYETTFETRRVPVVRFDNSHGRPHRDMMYLNGRREKLWFDDNLAYNRALDDAIDAIRYEWERCRDAFFRGYL